MKSLEIQHWVSPAVVSWAQQPSHPIVLCTLGSSHKHCKRASRGRENTDTCSSCQDVKVALCQYPGTQVLITTFYLTTVSHHCFYTCNSAPKSDSLSANYVWKTKTKDHMYILEILVPAMECWSHQETDILPGISPFSTAYSSLKRQSQTQTGFLNLQLQHD